jgi:hypothetical protein
MSNVFTTLGTTLSLVAGVPETFDDAGYAALTYVAVGEVGDLGEFGGTREVVTFTPVDTGIVAKRPGSVDYGQMTLQIARDAADVGQIALQSAFDGAEAGNLHSFKLLDRNGDILYYTGIVSSFTYNAGSANTMFGGSCTIDLTSKPLPVAAP